PDGQLPCVGFDGRQDRERVGKRADAGGALAGVWSKRRSRRRTLRAGRALLVRFFCNCLIVAEFFRRSLNAPSAGRRPRGARPVEPDGVPLRPGVSAELATLKRKDLQARRLSGGGPPPSAPPEPARRRRPPAARPMGSRPTRTRPTPPRI